MEGVIRFALICGGVLCGGMLAGLPGAFFGGAIMAWLS